MADAFTTRVRAEKPEVNANDGTWGDELNASTIDMFDEAIAGVVSVSVASGNVTLSTNNGTSDEARNPVIILTGSPGTTRTVTFPDVEGKHWIINSSDSTCTMTAGVGTTVSVLSGETVAIYTDGATNVGSLSPRKKSGTWTPVISDGTNNYTLSVAQGYYNLIGDVVFVFFKTTWTSIGSAGGGQLQMSGLPLTSANVANFRAGVSLSYVDGVDTTGTENQIVGAIAPNTTVILFTRVNDNATPTNIAANTSSSSGALDGSAFYRV